VSSNVIARALMQLAARLPLAVLHASGAALGWAIYALSPRYRKHLRENLDSAGYRDAATRRAAIAEAGKMITELPALWLLPHAEVAALVREVRGWELVEAARAAGRGIVFLTPHLGSFEISALYATVQVPMTILYRPPKIAWIEPFMRAGRERPNVKLATPDLRGVRRLLDALKRRETIGILPDQVPGEGEGEWAEFFGRPAYTMSLANKLAARDGAVCLIAFAERLPAGAGYALSIRPFPAPLPGESDTRTLNRAIEALIRERPQQYLWGYNRYKTPARAAQASPDRGASASGSRGAR
jgi:KDO2-lipid IV(A) lauroyltransferase